MNPDDENDLRPEELLEGLPVNSRELHNPEELAEFLQEWSDKEEFVEDLEHLASFRRTDIRPEEVFEHLAQSSNPYTVEEMIEASESIGDGAWETAPDIESTGQTTSTFLRDKASVPREYSFNAMPSGYIGESRFRSEGKEVWLQHHGEGWFQTEIEPLTSDEMMSILISLEEKAPVHGFHEVIYGNCAYFIDSEDLEYFFTFRDDLDEFDEPVYRIETDFDDFMMEASKLPGEEAYRMLIFSGEGKTYPLEAYRDTGFEEMTTGMVSRLRLNEKTR